MEMSSHHTRAVLLVGGMGTRLRSVLESMPKPLAPVGEQSFLELLLSQLGGRGIRDVVMCTGYLGDQIEREFGDGARLGMKIVYSREREPMGTGGAVALARQHLGGDPDFVVMNGDSFVEIDLQDFLAFHREQAGVASMAVRRVSNGGRYGTVEVEANGRVTSFVEKMDREAPALVNAGVYVFNSAIFEHIEQRPASLERDIFPELLEYGVYAYERTGIFIDIGTPEDYFRAIAIKDRLYSAAGGREVSSA